MDVRKRPHPLAEWDTKPAGSKGDVGIIRAKSSSAGPFSYLNIAIALAIVVAIATVIPTVLYSSTFDRLRGLWSSRVYAVIIDCGSTGSRLLAFTFRRSIWSQQLILEEELWEEVKPGLSSYAEDPKSAASSISHLVQSAKAHIPENQWHDTPITLKATAGLRLLSADVAESIIQEVEQVLVFSGFKIDKTLVEIMNPRDEGLYAWFTVNFLLDNFSHNLFDSYVSLDLGGGSTQITFAPDGQRVKGLEGRKHFLHNVTLLGERREIYSHSYLGLGLMAARQDIFTLGTTMEQGTLQSACMAASDPQPWSFHGKSYIIEATKGSSSFENCRHVVREIVMRHKVHLPVEIQSRNIAAFSYFYDRALDANIISKDSPKNRAKIQSFVDAATRACVHKLNDENPFLCVDLTYIVSLLVDGYGLSPDKEVHLFKRINGHEASWALGVAYSIVEER